MKKILWLFVMGVLAPLAAMAQGTVRGKIVDKATGEPVEFVNVVVTPKGSYQNTTRDFTLSATAKHALARSLLQPRAHQVHTIEEHATYPITSQAM